MITSENHRERHSIRWGRIAGSGTGRELAFELNEVLGDLSLLQFHPAFGVEELRALKMRLIKNLLLDVINISTNAQKMSKSWPNALTSTSVSLFTRHHGNTIIQNFKNLASCKTWTNLNEYQAWRFSGQMMKSCSLRTSCVRLIRAGSLLRYTQSLQTRTLSVSCCEYPSRQGE